MRSVVEWSANHLQKVPVCSVIDVLILAVTMLLLLLPLLIRPVRFFHLSHCLSHLHGLECQNGLQEKQRKSIDQNMIRISHIKMQSRVSRYSARSEISTRPRFLAVSQLLIPFLSIQLTGTPVSWTQHSQPRLASIGTGVVTDAEHYPCQACSLACHHLCALARAAEQTPQARCRRRISY